MKNIPDELFKKEVLYILKEEASHRTNEVKPLGISAWESIYKKELDDLKFDYLLTHTGGLYD